MRRGGKYKRAHEYYYYYLCIGGDLQGTGADKLGRLPVVPRPASSGYRWQGSAAQPGGAHAQGPACKRHPHRPQNVSRSAYAYVDQFVDCVWCTHTHTLAHTYTHTQESSTASARPKTSRQKSSKVLYTVTACVECTRVLNFQNSENIQDALNSELFFYGKCWGFSPKFGTGDFPSFKIDNLDWYTRTHS